MKKSFVITALLVSLSLFITACNTRVVLVDIVEEYNFEMSYAYAVPAVKTASTAVGNVKVTLNETDRTVAVTGTYSGLTGNATAAHIHGPASRSKTGDVVLPLVVGSGKLSLAPTRLTNEQITALKSGQYYINVHTAANPSGELRGQISNVAGDKISTYSVAMSSANAVPPVIVASGGQGSAVVTLNETQKTVSVLGSYRGLSSAPEAAHIHGPAPKGQTAGVIATLTITEDPVTTAITIVGSTSGKLSLNPTVLTNAQMNAMKAGLHYINLHTNLNQSGEIRGQIE